MLLPLIVYLCFIISALSIVPPKEPPTDLIPLYTLNGSIPIEHFYVDDTLKGEPTHFVFSEQEISQYISNANKIINRFLDLQSKTFGVPPHLSLPYQAASILLPRLPKLQWVQFGLFVCKPHIQGKKVAVIGSMEPWIEAFLIALGAAQVVTIEYNSLTYDHPKIVTVSQREFAYLYRQCTPSSSSNTNTSSIQHFWEDCHFQSFDFIISPSAFDHDGLGRYGDPLNPNGDILAMQQMQRLLKPDMGILFLTVPIGPDVLVFNLHRRYGPIRLPILLAHWQEIARLGWNEEELTNSHANLRKTFEPIFLLKFQQNPAATTIIQSKEEEIEIVLSSHIEHTSEL